MADDTDLTALEPNTLIEGPMWNGSATFIGMEQNGMLTIQVDGQRRTIPVPNTGHGIHVAEAVRGEPWKAYVAVERLRHECARNLGIPGTADQLPHQLKTIYQVAGEPGRIRYMIADEPGGGKTVVASRIMQELAIQKQARRVLIVVPALLKYQWQKELKRFVNMESRVVERDAHGLANPWVSGDRILITSMDYAKQDAQMGMLEQAKFDLVVVDEAHNLNATVKKSTARYKLGELLGSISNHMIFLTATPHRGKPDNFRLLLKLLEPDLFSNPKMSPGAVYHAKSRLFIRHAKNDMVDMGGGDLFLKRSVTSVKYAMSPTERRLYDTVTRYVERQYNLQTDRGANTISTFAVLVIQKRMASSTRALLESLKRRRLRLRERLEEWGGPVDDRDVDDADDMDDDEMENIENEAAGYTSAQTAAELEAELEELDGLIEMADKTSKTKPDTKLERLTGEIGGMGDDKLLIFSEYIDTLDYLEEKIAGMRRADGSPYDTCRIDGSMGMTDRVAAQEAFRTHSQIMLATDAAREGINLQFCHRMINYDLPWTPISLEQRMGRLHRYGQKHDVVISNMVAADTREGQVMETLFEKIRQIEIQYPTFNVMGQVLAGGDLKGLLTDAIRGGSTFGMAGKVAEAAERAKRVDEMLGHTPIDIQDVKRRMKQVEAQRTDGKYLVDMVDRLFGGLGGSVRHAGKGTRLEVPEAIRYGPLPKKRHAYGVPPDEVFARGGGIYEHLDGWIRDHCSGDLKFGSVFRDPSGFDGYVIFHTITIRDKAWRQVGRLLAAHKYMDGAVSAADPHVLHGMEYDDTAEAGPTPPMDHAQKAVLEMAHAEAGRMAAEQKKFWDHRTMAATERMAREAGNIQREMAATGFGAERNEMEERLHELDRRRDEVNAEHDMAVTLMPEAPVLEGWVRVVPDSDGAGGQDTEKIGMEASMKHERAEGFEVTDVHKQHGIGYDILSIHPDGRRREIEVKARCDMSCVQFTEAEREHLLRSEHAVIHVIGNVGRPDQTFTPIYDTKGVRLKQDTVYTMPLSELRRMAG